jgi:hypothetical protein
VHRCLDGNKGRDLSRMLKKPASVVLASFRPSTYPKGTPQSFTRYGLAVERRVLARWGWAGEKVAFLSILWECSPVVPLMQTIEVLARIAPYPEPKPPVPMVVYVSLSRDKLYRFSQLQFFW